MTGKPHHHPLRLLLRNRVLLLCLLMLAAVEVVGYANRGIIGQGKKFRDYSRKAELLADSGPVAVLAGSSLLEHVFDAEYYRAALPGRNVYNFSITGGTVLGYRSMFAHSLLLADSLPRCTVVFGLRAKDFAQEHIDHPNPSMIYDTDFADAWHYTRQFPLTGAGTVKELISYWAIRYSTLAWLQQNKNYLLGRMLDGLPLPLTVTPVPRPGAGRSPQSPQAQVLFAELLRDLRQRGCRILLVDMPLLMETESPEARAEFVTYLDTLAETPGISAHHDLLPRERGLFKDDRAHLGPEGKAAFNARLAELLRP